MDNQKEILEVINNLPRVSNVYGNSGQEVKNQFIIEGDGYTLFQSYKSPIALRKNGTVYLFKNWDYSTTTGKYRNKFLGETKAETLKKLKAKIYIAVDFIPV